MDAPVSSHHNSLPSFECRIPEELLKDLSPKEQRFYTQMDRTDQKMDWLLDYAVVQAETMEEVRVQVRNTNGQVAQAKADIIGLTEAVAAHRTETAPVVTAYKVGAKAAKSRLFWVAVAVLILVVVPWLTTIVPPPLVVAKALVALLIGM